MFEWQHKIMNNLAALFASGDKSYLTRFVMGEYCLIITPMYEVKFRKYPQKEIKIEAEQDAIEHSLCRLLDDDVLMAIQDIAIKKYQDYNAPEMMRGFLEDTEVNRAIANYVKSKCFNCKKNICEGTRQ